MTPAYARLQRQIWEALPPKKHMAGKEKIYDCISVVIQEWPEEALSKDDLSEAPIEVVTDLNAAVKRHMTLLYGSEDEFDSVWVIVLNILASQIIRLILEWWFNNKRNRTTLRRWRSRWRKDEDE